MPAPLPGPMVKALPKASDPVCSDPFSTVLYNPHVHRPECMKPPLLPNLEHCPIDDKVMLSDGKTRAIPYNLPGGNCNPYGLYAQKSAPGAISFAERSKNEAAADDKAKSPPTELYVPNQGNPKILKVAIDPMAIEHCPDFNER